MIRNRKSRGQFQDDCPSSIFRLNKSRSKNMFMYVCLIQAMFTLTSAVYVLMYHPWLFDDTPVLNETNDNAETAEETDGNKEGYSYKIAELTEEGQTAEGKVYAIFRFDKFLSRKERKVTKEMRTDDGEFVYFSKDNEYFVEDKPVWVDFKVVYEPGRFEEFGGMVVYMKNVQINPSLGSGKAGGEDVNEVLNQPAHEEYMRIQKGYFMYKTEQPFEYKLPVSIDIHRLADGLLVDTIQKEKVVVNVNRMDKVAIVTIRHDYANFYHSTMNWYDVFLIMVIFKTDPRDVEIIWLDSHPNSKMDDIWETLYGQPVRAGSFIRPVTYREVVWNGIGSRSQINAHKFDDLPFVNEFRHFVLSRFAISDVHTLNCESVKVTIIWRRDHLAHPRNPGGFVSRKIANEEGLWKAIKQSDDSLVVNGVQLDEISMHQQLILIAQTDILIGMHGAGLSHVLYLPQTSGVIELYPNYFSPANAHFRSFAKWRRLPYMNWVQGDKTQATSDHKTRLPVRVIKDMVHKMKNILCERNKSP